MIGHAAKLAGQETENGGAQAVRGLGAFKDGSGISVWAQTAAAYCVQAGIVDGRGGNLAPGSDLTRAEAAAMIMRMLRTAGLI